MKVHELWNMGSDSEVDDQIMVLFFESAADAQQLYIDLLTEQDEDEYLFDERDLYLVRDQAHAQYGVGFSPMTLTIKPQIVSAIIEAYRDYFSLAELTEALRYLDRQAQPLDEFNAYHDKLGRFTTRAAFLRAKRKAIQSSVKGKKPKKKRTIDTFNWYDIV